MKKLIIGLVTSTFILTIGCDTKVVTQKSVNLTQKNSKSKLSLHSQKKIEKSLLNQIKNDEKKYESLNDLSLFYLRTYQGKKAINVLDSSLEIKDIAYTHNLKANHYMSKNDYKEALVEYNLALQKSKSNEKKSIYHNNIGYVYALLKNNQLSTDHFKNSIKLYPDKTNLALRNYLNLNKHILFKTNLNLSRTITPTYPYQG